MKNLNRLKLILPLVVFIGCKSSVNLNRGIDEPKGVYQDTVSWSGEWKQDTFGQLGLRSELVMKDVFFSTTYMLYNREWIMRNLGKPNCELNTLEENILIYCISSYPNVPVKMHDCRTSDGCQRELSLYLDSSGRISAPPIIFRRE